MRIKDDGCREAFVEMIKEENFFADRCRQSLQQNWAGKAHGFKDEMVQRRWNDFQKGWDAARGAQRPGVT